MQIEYRDQKPFVIEVSCCCLLIETARTYLFNKIATSMREGSNFAHAVVISASRLNDLALRRVLRLSGKG